MARGELEAPRGVTFGTLNPGFVKDPRDTERVLGHPVQIGETIAPDPEYPGWKLTPFTFIDRDDADGCVFSVEANSATPIGIVGEPPRDEGSPLVANPGFTEFVVQGSGELLVVTDKLHRARMTATQPRTVFYGPGTKVAYIARAERLVGVNIGTPPGIPEDAVDYRDQRIRPEVWRIYDQLRRPRT